MPTDDAGGSDTSGDGGGDSSRPDPDGTVGHIELDGGRVPVALSDDIVERARANGIDPAELARDAVPDGGAALHQADVDVDFVPAASRRARAQDASSTIPVQDDYDPFLTTTLEDDFDFYLEDPQIKRLERNGVRYTEDTGRWLLRKDDLIPSVKERLKALIMGQDGLSVEPDDPDTEADQRLADHLEDVHRHDVRPPDVIDVVLEENFKNARAVLRSTDLEELEVSSLDYVKDGVTGEEIYIQDPTTVYTFDIEDGGDGTPDVDLTTESVDSRPLRIGEDVFDVALYDRPPLEAVVDTAVNKMVMERLKARKAELTSFGAVYAKVEPPSYLPEDQYFDRVNDDDFDGDGAPPTKLERALNQNMESAFDHLKEWQSGTTMAVPDNWSIEQISIPETGDPLDDQIRGYNKTIARRLLVPLDLIELREGAELSRETLFRTLLTTIQGWRSEILRVFEAFADVQAEIHDLPGDVEYSFPPIQNQDEELVVQALQYAGVAGLSQAEVRQLLNQVEGVDLTTEEKGPMPDAGGPDGQDRSQQMRELLEDANRGETAVDGPDTGPESGPDPSGNTPEPATAAEHDAEDVDTTPPEAVVNHAQDILDKREDPDVDVKGMTSTGWRRAEMLAAGEPLAVEEIVGTQASMANWWARHASHTLDDSGDRLTLAVDDGVDDPAMDNSWTAGKGWGGPAGAKWAWRKAAEITGDDTWREHVEEWTATATAAGGSGNRRRRDGSGGGRAIGPGDLADIPGIDDPTRLTREDVARLVLAAYEPEARADWNPALHPRGPDGKFVERPYDLPSDAMSVVNDDSFTSADLLEYLADDAANDVDVDGILADDDIRIDGVPDDVDTVAELKQAISDRRAGDGEPDPSEDFTEGIPDLPSGPEGHADVPLDVIDPEHSEAARQALKDQFEDGDVEIDGRPGDRGFATLGLDRGLPSLVADLTNSDNPSDYANLASGGSYANAGPYINFEPGDVEWTDVTEAAEAVDGRLPEGYYATPTSDGDHYQVDVRRRGRSFVDSRSELREWLDANAPEVDTLDEEAIREMFGKSTTPDPVDDFGYPTNEERAALDRAFIEGLRETLVTDPVPRDRDTRTREDIPTEEVDPGDIEEGDVFALPNGRIVEAVSDLYSDGAGTIRYRNGREVYNSDAIERGDTVTRYDPDQVDDIFDLPGVEPLTPEEGGKVEVPDDADPSEAADAVRTVQDYNDGIPKDVELVSGKISEELMDTARDQLETLFSRMRNREDYTDDDLTGRMVIGDEAKRANAATAELVSGETMLNIELEDPDSPFQRDQTRVVSHEFAHNFLQDVGFEGGKSASGDHRRGDWPDDRIDPDADDFAKWLIVEDDGGPGVGWEDWADDVRESFPTAAEDFEDPPEDLSDFESGDIIKFDESFPGHDGRTYEVLQVDDKRGDRAKVHVRTPDGGHSHFDATRLRDSEYKPEPVGVARDVTDPVDRFTDAETDFTSPGVDADVDAVRAEMDAETREERARQLANAANRAYYKMWLKKKYRGTEEPIKSAYSATTGHEVPTQATEVFFGHGSNTAENAERMANQYPRLTAAMLEIYDPVEEAKEGLRAAGVSVDD